MSVRERERSRRGLHTDVHPTNVEVRLIGGFGLTIDETAIIVPLSAQRVLAFVALRDRPVMRSYVAGSLWTDHSEERAAANLRSALWRLRRCHVELVEAIGPTLRIGSAVSVDLHSAIRLGREVETFDDGVGMDLDLLDGDLLPDWYDDWVLIDRERLRQTQLHVLDRLCTLYSHAGNHARAIDCGLRSIAAEPLRESAHSALLKAHLAEGNISEAAHHYHAYARTMHDAVGIEPSRALRELIENEPVRARQNYQ